MKIKDLRDDINEYIKKHNLEKKYEKSKKLDLQSPFLGILLGRFSAGYQRNTYQKNRTLHCHHRHYLNSCDAIYSARCIPLNQIKQI